MWRCSVAFPAIGSPRQFPPLHQCRWLPDSAVQLITKDHHIVNFTFNQLYPTHHVTYCSAIDCVSCTDTVRFFPCRFSFFLSFPSIVFFSFSIAFSFSLGSPLGGLISLSYFALWRPRARPKSSGVPEIYD